MAQGMARHYVHEYLLDNVDNMSEEEEELVNMIDTFLRTNDLPQRRVTGEELRPLLLKIWNNRRNF